MLAAAHGENALALLLLQSGADSSLTDSMGMSPLMLATLNGHLHTVEMLLSQGVDPMVANNEGVTAVTLAMRTTNDEIPTTSESSDTGNQTKKTTDEKGLLCTFRRPAWESSGRKDAPSRSLFCLWRCEIHHQWSLTIGSNRPLSRLAGKCRDNVVLCVHDIRKRQIRQ